MNDKKLLTLSQDIKLDQILVQLFESGKKYGREEADDANETDGMEPLWLEAKGALLELFGYDQSPFAPAPEDAPDD